MYVDTKDHLSERILSDERIPVSRRQEMVKEDSPFRLLICNIRKKDLERFYNVLETLRNNILICGYRGYDEVCELLNSIKRENEGQK
jgi:hypothetical protein